MKRSASEIIHNLERRIARLEKQSSVNHLIEGFQVSDMDSPKQIKLRLEKEIQDNFDGSFNVALKGVNHDTKSLYATGQVSFEIPIKYKKTTVLDLVHEVSKQKYSKNIYEVITDRSGNTEAIIYHVPSVPEVRFEIVKPYLSKHIEFEVNYYYEEKDTTSLSGKENFEKLKKQFGRIFQGQFQDTGSHLYESGDYDLSGDKKKDASYVVKTLRQTLKMIEKLVKL